MTSVRLDGSAPSGPEYWGIGAISGGGGNARLLIDYPQAQRSQILDYLFRPGYGASLQFLKLEIGGDSDSSTGAEPSVEPTQGGVDCNRGYEWWLAEQAVKRNPNIKLYGLQWGAPGWVAGQRDAAVAHTATSASMGTPGSVPTSPGARTASAPSPRSLWSQDDVSYVLDWLGCARSHGLNVSYLGGWNERFTPTQDSAGVSWFKEMRNALDSHGYRNVELVASDAADHRWDVAQAMASDRSFRSSVGVIGVHNPCGYPAGIDGDKTPFGYRCFSSATARSLGKPLWASEDGKLDSTVAAPTLLREILNGYNQARITGVVEYPLVTATLDDLPLENRGLVTARTPWSGAYQVNNVAWSLAHVTQFVPPGWRHVNGANRTLGATGSFNTFESPDHRHWSLVAQNTGAYQGQEVVPQTLKVQMTGHLTARTVHVWASNMWSQNPARRFMHLPDVHPRGGAFTYRIPAGFAISFTTRSAPVHKGGATGPSPAGPTTLAADYTATPDPSGMPTYLSPIDGSYNYEPCAGGRTGQCLAQQNDQPAVYWLAPTTGERFPHALVGQDGWTDYTVSSDVLLSADTDQAGLISRFQGSCPFFAPNCQLADAQDFDGYEFNVAGNGAWTLYRNAILGGRTVLDSGTLASPLTGAWHQLSVQASGDTITASVDGQPVTTTHDSTYTHGLAGIESSWSHVQYDGLSVTSDSTG